MQYLRLNEILEDVEESETITFERLRFNGGENHIKLKSLTPEQVTIEVQLKNSDYVMELFLATDALRRSGVKEIFLLCPYIPYSRQDRVMVKGEPLSIKVFTQMLNAQNYKTIYTLDNHSPVSTALIDRCREIDNIRILSTIIEPRNSLHFPNRSLLISPDAGSYKKICQIGQHFGMKIVQASKVRSVKTGEITHTEINVDDLCKKDCYIIDDICDGSRTFIKLAKVLNKKNSGRVYLYVSHGIFSYGVDELKEHINKIYTTNMFRSDNGIKKWGVNIIKLRKEDLK